MLAGLRGVAFDWAAPDARSTPNGTRGDIGFVAQEIERVLPEVVNVEADGYRSMDYAKLTAVLVEVAKAQQTQIEARRGGKPPRPGGLAARGRVVPAQPDGATDGRSMRPPLPCLLAGLPVPS